jgi:hypothetical protein
MKNIYAIALLIAATIFSSSCKKDEFNERDEYKLTYTFQCTKCTIELDGNNGKRTKVEVTTNETFTYRSKKKFAEATATSTSYVALALSVNDKLLYSGAHAPNPSNTMKWSIITTY